MTVGFWPRWFRWGRKQFSRPGAQRSMERLERTIGYHFRDREHLHRALKHRSVIATTGESRSETNERLEFLGDAVLDLVIREELLEKYPDSREGHLTRLKSMQVSGRQLARVARTMELGAYLQMSAGEDRSGGRLRSSILEDALEAVIGAIYLDGGLGPAKRFIDAYIATEFEHGREPERDRNHKSLLLEHMQAKGLGHPAYTVVDERGPDHAKIFSVEVLVGEKVLGRGQGRNKKQAEQNAAREALANLAHDPDGNTEPDADEDGSRDG